MFQRVHLGSVRSSPRWLLVWFWSLCIAGTTVLNGAAVGQESSSVPSSAASTPSNNSTPAVDAPPSDKAPGASAIDTSGEIAAEAPKSSSRVAVLIGSLTVFVLAVFVGFEIINKVPPTLHTPLMSGSNAISGITVVGAILATGFGKFGFGSLLGGVAIILAMINVAGGFWVTHRMLAMFKKK